MSRYISRAIVGNRWFRKICEVHRGPRYFFVTDIVMLCHNIGGGWGNPHIPKPYPSLIQNPARRMGLGFGAGARGAAEPDRRSAGPPRVPPVVGGGGGGRRAGEDGEGGRSRMADNRRRTPPPSDA